MIHPSVVVTLIHSRDQLLSAEPLPEPFKTETIALLREIGVEVITSKRVLDIKPCNTPESTKTTLVLSDGSEMCVSHVIKAVSKPSPTTGYLPSKALNAEGEVPVLETLQFPDTVSNSAVHFAIGDIAAWPPNNAPYIKRCGTYTHG